jgi:hypothetical protein
MSAYLLDTDWIVDILNGQEQAIHTAVELAPAGLAVSIITYGGSMKAQPLPMSQNLRFPAYEASSKENHAFPRPTSHGALCPDPGQSATDGQAAN